MSFSNVISAEGNITSTIATSLLQEVPRDIAIFGLSGNPPTGEGGHAGIVQYLVQSGEFQEVWVLPVFQHQFFSKRSLAPFQTRVELCQLAFESFSSETCAVRVLAVEQDVEKVVQQHGTIDTLNFIKAHNPATRLHLVLGSDTYNDISMGKWKGGER
jgi:nicotinic acid mononucleotide adenylyltransferase